MELCARHYREQSQRFSSFRSPIMSVAGRNIPRRPGTLVEPLPMAGSLDLNEKDDCFRRVVSNERRYEDES